MTTGSAGASTVSCIGSSVRVVGAGRLRIRCHADRPGDEVRVALDGAADGGRLAEIVQRVLGVLGLEVQRDRRTLRRVGFLGDGVRALAGGFPADPGVRAGLASDQGDPVGDHETGVEADAELPDQLGGRFLGRLAVLPRLPQRGEHLRRAGLGDRADEVDHLLPGHPDAVVAHGQRPRGGVRLQRNVQVGGVDLEVLVLVSGQPELVQGVGGVGDQLPKEDVLGRVDRMDHQLQQLTRLRLELDGLGRPRRC